MPDEEGIFMTNQKQRNNMPDQEGILLTKIAITATFSAFRMYAIYILEFSVTGVLIASLISLRGYLTEIFCIQGSSISWA